MAQGELLTSSEAFGGKVKPLGFDFEIVSAQIPFLHLQLHRGKRFLAENGAMMMKDSAIAMDVGFGNGLNEQGFGGALWSGLKRKIAGEGFLTQKFTNESSDSQRLLLAAPHPGQILAVNLHDLDGKIYCQRGSFLAAPAGTDVSIHIRQKLGFALFGGEEFVMQEITGDDVVFLHAGGGLHAEELSEDETIELDTGCLVATTANVKTSITKAGSLKSALLGQEGFFLAQCKGPGHVWIQSMPFSRSVAAVTAEQQRQANTGTPKSTTASSPK